MCTYTDLEAQAPQMIPSVTKSAPSSRPLYVARVCRVWRCCELIAYVMCLLCASVCVCVRVFVCVRVRVCAWLDSFTYARSLLKVTSRRLLDTYGEQDSQSKT